MYSSDNRMGQSNPMIGWLLTNSNGRPDFSSATGMFSRPISEQLNSDR